MSLNRNSESNEEEERPLEPPPSPPDEIIKGRDKESQEPDKEPQEPDKEPPPAPPDYLIKMLTEKDLERFTAEEAEEETGDKD